MRIIWLTFSVISLAAATVIWLFAAGWAGQVVFYPDLSLISSGDWALWIAVTLLMYAPVALGIVLAIKAMKAEKS